MSRDNQTAVPDCAYHPTDPMVASSRVAARP